MVGNKDCVAIVQVPSQIFAQRRRCNEVARLTKSRDVRWNKMANLVRESQERASRRGKGHWARRMRVHHRVDDGAYSQAFEVNGKFTVPTGGPLEYFAIPRQEDHVTALHLG